MFKDVFIPALKTTWRKKLLWLIAILTITPATIGNEWITATNLFSAATDPTGHFLTLSSFAEGFTAESVTISDFLKTLVKQPIESVVFILSLAVIAVLTIFFIWVIVNAQAIVIAQSKKDSNEKWVSLNRSLTESSGHWHALTILNVGYNLIRLFMVTVFLLILLKINSTVLAGVYIFFVLSAGTALMAISFIVRFAIMYVVLEGSALRSALRKGKTLFIRNIGVSFEISFILAFITIIFIGAVRSLLLIFFSEDEFSLSIINILLFREGFPVFIWGIFFILCMLVVSGFVLRFQYAVWVRWFEHKEKPMRSYIRKFFGILNRRKRIPSNS